MISAMGAMRLLRCALLAAVILPAGTVDLALAADSPDRGKPVAVNLAEMTVAAPGTEVRLAITFTPATSVPAKSFVRIRGIPPSVTLTEGRNIAPGVWAIPLVGLPNLALRIPSGLSGKAEVLASLVSLDGNIIDEARGTILIGPTGLLAAHTGDPEAASLAPAESPAAPADTAQHGPSSGGGVHSGAPLTREAATREPHGALSSFPPQTLSSATRAAPAAKSDSASSRREARAILARAMKQLAAHDLPGARTLFERAADLGSGEAAMRLAATYDPHELSRQKRSASAADVKLAHKWYTRAAALGVHEAKSRLQRLATR
jgi:hypothetical protein